MLCRLSMSAGRATLSHQRQPLNRASASQPSQSVIPEDNKSCDVTVFRKMLDDINSNFEVVPASVMKVTWSHTSGSSGRMKCVSYSMIEKLDLCTNREQEDVQSHVTDTAAHSL